MKKAYAKPVITFEDFAFSSNVAGECGGVSGIHAQGACAAYGLSGSPETCQFYDSGYYLFAPENGCDFGPDDGILGNLCYHVNTAANRIFKS